MRESLSNSETKEPIITKSFCFAFFAAFCGVSIMYMLVTTVSEYAQSFGANKTISGLVSSIFLLGGLITRLFFGRLVSRFGWKKIIVFSMIFQFLACCLYFTITNIYQLLTVRFIHGCSSGLAGSVGSTTGQYLIPKSRYGEGNGLFMLSNALSVCFGPLAGGILFDRFGSRGCFTAAVILAACMAIGIVLSKAPYPDLESFRKDTAVHNVPLHTGETLEAEHCIRNIAPGKTHFINQFIEKDTIPAAACIFFCGFAYSCILSFIRLFGKTAGLSEAVSLFFVVYAVVLIISRPTTGKLQDRYGDDKVVYPCVFMQIVGFLILFLVPNSVTVTIAAIMMALGYGTLNSVFMTIACRNASYERLPYAIVTYWIAIDSGVGIGPVFLGAVAENSGYGIMFLSAAVITAAVLPIYFLLCHKNKRSSAQH